MNLFLVRHGLSEANIKKLVTGDTNDPLSEAGVEALKKAHPWFSCLNVPFAAGFTSQWRRAQETACILFPGQSFFVDERLGETHAGSVANWTLQEFINKWPDFYQNPQRSYPDGESHEQLNERVMAWLEWVCDKYLGENVLAVCHSGPIACLIHQALKIPLTRFPVLLPTHASVTVIQYQTDSSGWHPGHLKVFSASDIETLASIVSIPLG
jgi:broad specificity phosphatase PhoE